MCQGMTSCWYMCVHCEARSCWASILLEGDGAALARRGGEHESARGMLASIKDGRGANIAFLGQV